MRPVLRFLTDDLADRIIDEARDLLCELGMKIHNTRALELLSDHGAQVDLAARHVGFTPDLIDKALETAPASILHPGLRPSIISTLIPAGCAGRPLICSGANPPARICWTARRLLRYDTGPYCCSPGGSGTLEKLIKSILFCCITLKNMIIYK